MNRSGTYLRLGDRLCDLYRGLVMAIVNVTPDSFLASSRAEDELSLRRSLSRVVSEGADIIDIGACSTRPSVQSGAAVVVSEEQEWQRLQMALEVARETGVQLPLSVDTFRPAVAQRAIEEYGVAMINDVSGGSEEMFGVVERYNPAYVLTYNRLNDAHPSSDLLSDALAFLSRRVDELHRRGVSDVVVDPGFGFGQTVEESLRLLEELGALQHPGCPVLAGLSRKRMAYEPAGLTPDNCLDETLRLERIALDHGARILRVHDVEQTVRLLNR